MTIEEHVTLPPELMGANARAPALLLDTWETIAGMAQKAIAAGWKPPRGWQP